MPPILSIVLMLRMVVPVGEACDLTVEVRPDRAVCSLEGLEVRARNRDSPDWERFQLDNRGHFVMRGVRCGEWIVEVGQRMGTLNHEWFSTIAQTDVAVTDSRHVEITLPLLQRFTIEVRDSEGDPQGPVGVRIEGESAVGDVPVQASVRVDQSGDADVFLEPGTYRADLFSIENREVLEVMVDGVHSERAEPIVLSKRPSPEGEGFDGRLKSTEDRAV